MNKDGKVKLIVLIIALGVGWFGSFLTTSKYPEVGIFLLFASLTSLSRLATKVASRALAILALGAWYVAFPDQRGQEEQMILLPILIGGSAFLIALLLREIVHALLEGGEGGQGDREEGKKEASKK